MAFATVISAVSFDRSCSVIRMDELGIRYGGGRFLRERIGPSANANAGGPGLDERLREVMRETGRVHVCVCIYRERGREIGRAVS